MGSLEGENGVERGGKKSRSKKKITGGLREGKDVGENEEPASGEFTERKIKG